MRTKEGQKKHDAAVAVLANALIRNRWNTVYSDLPGNPKPPTIGGYIPDVYGKNGFDEIVIEIETADTKDAHSVFQHAAFQSWANAGSNRKFLVRLA